MTAPTLNGTRYPQPIDELVPRALAWAEQERKIPSRNALMRQYRIGAPKADAVRAEVVRLLAGTDLAEKDATPAPDLTGLTGPAMIQAAIDIADERGEVPTAAEYAAVFGLAMDRASALAELVSMAPRFRANTPPVDTDEPIRNLWDYAEPIGPHPAPAPAPVAPEHTPPADPTPTTPAKITPAEQVEQVTVVGHPDTPTPPKPARPAVVWPVVLLALPAFVAIWSGWVGLGGLTGFGVVHPLPGIADGFSLNTAITLPIGVETYGAYALYVWLSGRVPDAARRFAKWSALGSLAVGALGQVAYHLLVAAGIESAPWWITTAVACLPVAVLGMGAALAHLVRTHD